MKPFRQLRGIAAPVAFQNVDTASIIRIERLIEVPRGELGRYAFETYRFLADGSENPDFTPNQPRFKGAQILLGGENFGCGSSREQAIWALQGWGIACVVAPSFGDIFYGNALQNGLLLVRLPQAIVATLMEELHKHAPEMAVDLNKLEITSASGTTLPFSMEDDYRAALLSGLDEIERSMELAASIDSWRTADAKNRPWCYEAPV